MNLAVGKSIVADIYIDNDYEGNLSRAELNRIDSIDWHDWFGNWLCSLNIDSDLSDCELSLKLTSDRQMQQYNYQYRHLDRATDVLAFAAMESEIALPAELLEPLYLGDIIISLDTAKRQAIEQKHSLELELAWLSSHGLLHLLGWDHPNDESLQKMLARQSKLIHSLNVFNAK